MIFKKIEVYGFKSFADKLQVDFSGGVTAIVGPNGCGKSNISDAVRWVLGEQSSKILRGTNMQDVIFKGTETRAPLGYCEVSLHFDNTTRAFPIDYDELVISRKLFKSGESEYFINRKTARLKDITGLLHDSGIDRDGLTIISQGQVAEVISSKPETRRAIFEEAAGIAKFKSRKTEAERKLERTAADLVRVTDVITEIERNLKPLQKQAEAAAKYLVLRDKLKLLEINAYVAQYDTAAADKEKLRIELDAMDTDMRAKHDETVRIARQIIAATDEIQTIDNKSEQLREELLNLSVGLEREQNEKRLENLEKMNALKLEHAQLLAQKRTLENLVASGEGYKYAVKRIIASEAKQPPMQRKTIGVVAQELTVPAHLETAIEVALGASTQNIITRDEDGARALIEMLKRENWGRCTFLPLTAAREKSLSVDERDLISKHLCLVGVASELVTYNELIKPVVGALLGRIVIVDKLENAIIVAKQSRYSFKIVTLDGDVIEPRGAITGGSHNTQNNHLWHNNNLAQISASLSALEKRMSDLDKTAKKPATQPQAQGDVAKLDIVKAELAQIAMRKDELRAWAAKLEKMKQDLTDQVSEITRQYYRTEGNLARIDINIEQMQTRIEEEYGMNYSACYMFLQENVENASLRGFKEPEATPPLPFDLAAALPQITALKREINRLGPVNLGAIEAAAEQQQRYDDYSTQVADLTAAKADLEKVIHDLGHEMEAKFKSAFEKINHNFGIVFKELFGGGHAKLELVPVDGKIDWLQSGIEIIAEPAGKKLANLTLLSGGEKALTAIAILFAILKLRPMPFCLLDEIEAALDEANVGRFANYLQKFAKTTQFIVITHRKPTMELANNLYGVTMEEKGVSKLVSVKLEQWNADYGEVVSTPHPEEAVHA